MFRHILLYQLCQLTGLAILYSNTRIYTEQSLRKSFAEQVKAEHTKREHTPQSTDASIARSSLSSLTLPYKQRSSLESSLTTALVRRGRGHHQVL